MQFDIIALESWDRHVATISGAASLTLYRHSSNMTYPNYFVLKSNLAARVFWQLLLTPYVA